MLEPWEDDAFLARFAAKIMRGDGSCWVWSGATVRGRASIKFRGIAVSAPRLAKIIHDRAWPSPELQACHTCDNPLCVKADHLWWGTNQENALDAAAKGRFPSQKKSHCSAGHSLNGENIRLSRQGHRICRICAAARQRRWRSTEGESAIPQGDAQ